MTSPLGVVVVTYNAANTIQATLESLVIQAIPLEIVIVDNASSDDTVDRIRAIDFGPHSVKVEVGDENVGFAQGCNAGAALLTNADDLLLINPDVELPGPDFLTRALASFHSLPLRSLLAVRLLRPDGTLDKACRRNEPTLGRALAYWFLRGRVVSDRWAYHPTEPEPEGSGHVDATTGAFMLLSLAFFRELGGFDERFWMYAEDLDLCRRVRLKGAGVWFDGELVAVHTKSAANGGKRPLKAKFHFWWSMFQYAAKHRRATR